MEAVKIDDQEKQASVRKAMFDTFCQQYHSLATFIQKLPINADMKGKVCLYLDSGFLWAKEAFVLLEIEANKAKLAAVENDAADNVEVTDAVTDFANEPVESHVS